MRFPPQFLDELRTRTSLADVIGRKVKLTKKGREHTGLCPFHSEKTPSFTVSEEKGFYHCFGCGAHGDAIAFLTESEGVAFPEAVERLAGEAGMEIPQLSPREEEAFARRSTLYDVLEAAAGWFENKLATPQGEEAREYLKKRGLSDEVIRHFRIGFAPRSRNALKDTLLGQKITEDQLVESGMLVKAEDKDRTYDRFRNRIIFPIADARGRVVAFGGRAMGSETKAKYLNSPETPLFHKGDMLYNLAGARKAAFEKSEVIVAEGYMDVIALHQAGFEQAVAPLGTALTEAQIGLLWRLAPEPVLCFDGDQAGVRAAGRALERALPLLKPGHSLRFALLPHNEDPDSLIQREGATAFTRVLEAALSLSDMLWRLVTQGVDISTPERRAGLEKKVFDAIGPIRDEKVRGFYMRDFRDRLFHTFRPQKTSLSSRFGPAGAGQRRGRPGGRKSNMLVGTPLGRAVGEAPVHAHIEELLVVTLLNHPALLIAHHEDLVGLDLANPELDRLRRAILEATERDSTLDPEGLRDHLLEKGFQALYMRLTESQVMKSDWFAWSDAALADAEKGWIQTLKRYRRITTLQQEYEAAQEELSRNTTQEGFSRLMALQEEMQANSGNESDLEGYGLASERPVT